MFLPFSLLLIMQRVSFSDSHHWCGASGVPCTRENCDTFGLQQGLLTCPLAPGPRCLFPFPWARSLHALEALRQDTQTESQDEKISHCEIPFLPPVRRGGSWGWVQKEFKVPEELLISICRVISGQVCLAYSIFIFKDSELLLNCQFPCMHCVPEVLECVYIIEC